MTDQQLYCDGPGVDLGTECGRPVAGHGGGDTGTPKCSTHIKQLQRTGEMTPIQEDISPKEKLINAANALAEADSDEEFDRAERAVTTAGIRLGKKAVSEAIRNALAAARARGVHVGRPPKVSAREVVRLFKLLRSVSLVAAVMKVHRNSITPHLKRGRKKTHEAKRPSNAHEGRVSVRASSDESRPRREE